METHRKLKYIYVGVDCHKATHTASIVNAFKEPLGNITFNNDEKGFLSLTGFVSKYTSEGLTPIYGLEDCNHLGHSLAMHLLSKNCIVKVVNAVYTYNERKSSPIISKTDKIDSLCIAKVTLDRLDTLPNASNDEIYWTLKQLCKMRETIIDCNIDYKNKLHAQLLHHYPNYKKFFYDTDAKTSLAFWETFPNPIILKNTPFEKVSELITKESNGYLKASKAKQILELINDYEYNLIDYQKERDFLIKMLVKQIKYNNTQIDINNKQIEKIIEKLGYKLHTFIGIDKVSSARIISQIGNINRFSSSDKLAKYAGIAPVCFSSGEKDKKVNNKYGNRLLNSYIYMLACIHINQGNARSNPRNAIFLNYYLKKLSEGKTKHQAILLVMRRLINIIYGMMKNKTEYVHPKELGYKCLEEYRENQKDKSVDK